MSSPSLLSERGGSRPLRIFAAWLGRGLDRATLGRVVVAAVVVRVIWLLICPADPLSSDTLIYHQGATSLAAGRGFLDASGQPQGWWPVGYPALLAPFYRIFGARPTVAHAVNVLLAALTVAGIHRLALLLFGERSARLAALSFALHPTFILFASCVASENAMIPAVVWLAWLFARVGRDERAWRLSAAAGLVLGGAVYVRPTSGALLAAPVLLGLLRRERGLRVAGRAAVVGAVALAVLWPWGLRNERAFGVFSVTSMNGASNLWMGNHPGSDGGACTLPGDLEEGPVVPRERLLRQQALRFIGEHPGTYLTLVARRLWLTLRSDTAAVEWNASRITERFGSRAITGFKALTSGVYYLLVAAAIAAARRRRRAGRDWRDRYLAGLLALLALPFVLIVGGNRYLLPLLPFLAVWAAALLATSQARQAEVAMPAQDDAGRAMV
jgi:4-amino-4-deoxy-L-arabinose transferase-like glycosyltransferase